MRNYMILKENIVVDGETTVGTGGVLFVLMDEKKIS